jgi:DNA-binding PadR family transcriptional regulator
MVIAMARRPQNPLALAVLTLLDERPMHPYEMSTTLRERRKEESIRLNYGSLYSVVESMKRNGLIEALGTSREGRRPERTVYAITATGRVELHDWLGELLSTPRKEFTQFEAALSLLGALPPDRALRLLDLRLQTLELDLRARAAIRAAVGDFLELFMIESDYEMALLEAEAAFVRRLVDRIRGGALGGVDAWRRLHELREQDLAPEEIDAAMAREFPGSLMGGGDARPPDQRTLPELTDG